MAAVARRAPSLDVLLLLAGFAGCARAPLSAGEAQTATAIVTPGEGGVVALADGSARLEIAPGAVTSPRSITITRTMRAAPAGVTADSPVFDFEPAGLSFKVPARVTLAFARARRPGIYWSNDLGGYDALGGDVSGATITAAVRHFSSGFVGELPGAPPDLDGDGGTSVALVADASADAPAFDAGLADVPAEVDAGAATCAAPGASGRWVNRAPPVLPAAWPITRNNPAFVFDVATSRTVMYGGYGGPGAQFLQDTWEWNGAAGAWTQRTGTMPASFDGTSVTYDDARERLVLFATLSAELWEWNGPATKWEQRVQAALTAAWPSTTSEFAASAAYDPERQRVVVFQSAYGKAPVTWEWDPAGGTWSDRSPSTSPSGLGWIVWDPAGKRCVGFGGQTLNEVWEWDGQAGTWTMRPKVGAWPGARSGAAMVLDASAGRPLLFGGQAPGGPFDPAQGPPPPTYDTQLWEWQGDVGQWRVVDDGTSSVTPAGRTNHAMTYDSARSCVVMFGGGGPSMSLVSATSELWEWTRSPPSSCDGGR
jgi:Galactose oxidase, central domain